MLLRFQRSLLIYGGRALNPVHMYMYRMRKQIFFFFFFFCLGAFHQPGPPCPGPPGACTYLAGVLGDEAHEAVGGQREEAVRVDDLVEVLDHEALDALHQLLEAVLDRDLQEREAVLDRDVPASSHTHAAHWSKSFLNLHFLIRGKILPRKLNLDQIQCPVFFSLACFCFLLFVFVFFCLFLFSFVCFFL